MIFDDAYFMREAIKEAEKAVEAGEVPVGAVMVYNDKIVARAHNQTELLNDVTAHAEILCITSVSASTGNKFLEDYSMYVTLEPCAMCAGAISWSRIGKLVFGASDQKAGFSNYSSDILHPKTALVSGVEAVRCSAILTEFFKERRRKI
ncbi:MAG: tRNA-specific adenosine deaminase [Marinilabiliales bacterium]|nr:MAG: tRNA-specific adenosine deaminase [Marinilabiliales bacterium]